METAKKLGENVFLISWTTKNHWRYNYSHEPCETIVNIGEISQSCQLRSRRNETKCRYIVLDVVIYPTEDNNRINMKPASVSLIKNDVEKTMKFLNSKWTTTFSVTCPCDVNDYSMPTVNLLVLIEFTSTFMKTETKHVMDHLLNLWETKTLADVTFKFYQGRQVKAHTLIIASGSPVLAAMFQNDFKEKQERVVIIKDAKASVFRKMLRFFYTGDADLDNVDASDLLILANRYGVDSLKDECAFYLAQHLTVNCVIRCLIVSHLHQSPYLYKSALEFISENSEAIVTENDWVDLMKNYHELSLAAVKMMVLSKKKSLQ